MLQEEGVCASPPFLQGGSISVTKYDQDTAFKSFTQKEEFIQSEIGSQLAIENDGPTPS